MKKRINIALIVLVAIGIPLLAFRCYKYVEYKMVNAIFIDVMERYQEPYRVVYGSVSFSQKVLKDEEGFEYFILEEENYTSVEDIRVLLESIFTQNYINNSKHWVIGTTRPFYKEIDGVLCKAHSDAIALGIPTELHKIESKSDTRLVLLALTDLRWFRFTLVKEGDEWFIDDIDVDWLEE